MEDLGKECTTKQENGKNALVNIVFWIFGAFFLFLGLCSICAGSCIVYVRDCIAGLFFLIAAALVIPPVSTKLEAKLNISMTETTRLVIAFVLFSAAIVALPPPPDTHDATDYNVTLVTATISFDDNNTAVPSDMVSAPESTNAATENQESWKTENSDFRKN